MSLPFPRTFSVYPAAAMENLKNIAFPSGPPVNEMFIASYTRKDGNKRAQD
jgi:hypothetical protein